MRDHFDYVNWGGKTSSPWVTPFPRQKVLVYIIVEEATWALACMHSFLSSPDFRCNVTSDFTLPMFDFPTQMGYNLELEARIIHFPLELFWSGYFDTITGKKNHVGVLVMFISILSLKHYDLWKIPYPNTIILGVRLQHMNLKWTQTCSSLYCLRLV